MVQKVERPLDLLNASKGKEVLVQLKGEKAVCRNFVSIRYSYKCSFGSCKRS